jgi:hypothetical protein
MFIEELVVEGNTLPAGVGNTNIVCAPEAF